MLLLTGVVYAQNEEWIARYEPGNTAEAIAVDYAGNVYVAGWGSGAGTSFDYITIKYSSIGDTLWVRRYDSGDSVYDYAHSLAIDDAGNAYVTGRSVLSDNNTDIATVKYNSVGVEQWVARYDGGGDDEGYDVVVDETGNVYVTGVTSINRGVYYITIKYDSSGDTMWTAAYGGPDNAGCIAYALALDDSGNVYVTGQGYSSATWRDYATIKYDSSGTEVWVAVYDGLTTYAEDVAHDIAYRDGYLYVTGESENAANDHDYYTIKYTSAGDTVWTARHDGPDNGNDEAYALDVDGDGNVYVTGESFYESTSVDYATIKYNSSGDVEWTTHYNSPDSASDQARALAVDNMGNVYVTGRSYAYGPYTPEYDYLTVKYNSSGVEQWTSRYDGTGHTQDEALAIAVDTVGFVYVTGGSTGSTSYEDFLTIKYATTGIEEVTRTGKQKLRLSVSPNPFHSATTISFGALPGHEHTELKIHDVTGRLVRKFNLTSDAQCLTQISWDGCDQTSQQLSSGVYFLRLEAGDMHEVEKLLLLR
jgi:uncharacterized delta-60 repeat protein